MLDGSYYVECRCGTIEHTLRFILDKQEKEVYSEIQLNHYMPWYKRILPGIKYIFGSKFHGTNWDCWVMDETNIEQFKQMITDFENIIKGK